MTRAPVPQPSVDRMVGPAGHAVVVGVTPGQPELVLRTAAAWARALGAPGLQLAYADTSRYVVREHPDGTVDHAPLDPDTADDAWRQAHDDLRAAAARVLGADDVPWRLDYLAGRPDRALTHLARAVDASVLVVGTRSPGTGAHLRELAEGSVAAHLAHHQHRPVLTVPLSVVDWRATRATWR